MSVDLGSEWMKVAIVSPGVPMEIVLNTDSQRKTPLVISFRDGERLIGDAGQTVSTRFPDKAFSYFLDLLAKHQNSSAVQLFHKRFPYHKIVDTLNGISLSTSDGQQFTPEELISMVLSKAKTYAEEASKQTINDCVITVPAFFTQAERRALLLAADLAKLKVLQLINTNTAFSLNYGVFRRKDFNTTVTNILFYDMGASSTTATIASYQLVKTKDRGFVETNPQLTIKGIGFDRTLGGLEMQIRLRDHLAQLFAEQSKKPLTSITSNHRAMAKLFKEAGRLKKVLSANTEHKAQVENVMNDIDLKAMVTRQDFEDLCADMFGERLTQPIDEAFRSSGYTPSEIDSVIIVGGNTRVPKVQHILTQYFGKDLSKSINADEGAAMGAAYQAAYLSKGFKVKTFVVKDANLYPIQVDFERETEDGARKVLSRTLFARNNAFPQKKVLTFNKHSKDFEFGVNYGQKPEDFSSNIFNVSLKGVSEAIGKHVSEESKGIKAHFRMDENGLLNLEQVEAVFETRVEDDQLGEDVGNIVGDALSKFGNTISKLFGQTDDETNVEKANETESNASNETNTGAENKTEGTGNENVGAGTDQNQTESTSNSTTNQTQSAEQKKELKIKTIKELIDSSVVVLDFQPLTEDGLNESRNKLQQLDEKESEKLNRDKAKNTFESFILETRDRLEQKEYLTSATDEEKSSIESQLSAGSEWLEYESDGADTKLFNEKLSDLKGLTRALFDRVREHRERPEALAALNNMLNISEMFFNGAQNVSKEDQIFTDVELQTLNKLIDDTKAWVDSMSAQQNKLARSQTPKMTLKSIAEKIASLDREVKYLLNKARITPPKPRKVEVEDKDNTTDQKETKEEIDRNESTSDEERSGEEQTPNTDDTIRFETNSDGAPDLRPDTSAPKDKLDKHSSSDRTPTPAPVDSTGDKHTEL